MAVRRGPGRPAIPSGVEIHATVAPEHLEELDACLADLARAWPADRAPPRRADAVRLALERSARVRVGRRRRKQDGPGGR